MTHGDMRTKHAPIGYEAFYEQYGSDTLTENAVEIPNLPVGEPIELGAVGANLIDLLETRAHDAHVLLSTDALNFIVAQSTNEAENIELLDMVLQAAKAHYPKEDGWVVINKERILSLLK
jgi:hypothetical protein